MITSHSIVRVGTVFRIRKFAPDCIFTRLPDDPSPMFEYERIRLECKYIHPIKNANGTITEKHVFAVEPEWFIQRGLVASP